MRDNNFTKKQLRGIDITISAARKTYPYIKGWEFSNGYEKYETTLYIILLVEIDKIEKVFNTKITNYHEKEIKLNPDKIYSTPTSMLEDNTIFGSDEWDEKITKSVEYSMELKKFVAKLYENLPEEYKIYYSSNLYPEHMHETSLGVDGYKIIKD